MNSSCFFRAKTENSYLFDTYQQACGFFEKYEFDQLFTCLSSAKNIENQIIHLDVITFQVTGYCNFLQRRTTSKLPCDKKYSRLLKENRIRSSIETDEIMFFRISIWILSSRIMIKSANVFIDFFLYYYHSSFLFLIYLDLR